MQIYAITNAMLPDIQKQHPQRVSGITSMSRQKNCNRQTSKYVYCVCGRGIIANAFDLYSFVKKTIFRNSYKSGFA